MEDELKIEFVAVLMAILDYLKHGEVDRAIEYIEQVLRG